MKSIKAWLIQDQEENRDIEKVLLSINIKRIYIGFLIISPFSLGLFVHFRFLTEVSNATEEIWRNGLATTHGIFSLSFVLMFLITHVYVKKQGSYLVGRMIQILSVTLILSMGIAITLYDLVLFNSIAPFLIATMVVGLIILTRPIHAILIQGSSLLVFLGFVLTSSLSNTVITSIMSNAIMATSIGFIGSLLMFQLMKKQILQQRIVLKQQDDLEMLNRELKYLASHDDLTKLYNRRTFAEKIQKDISQVQNYEAAIGLFDIDHFKQINDQFGHPTGDYILKALANLVLKELKSGEYFARWGGEEFILYFPNSTKEAAFHRVEEIRELIANYEFAYQGERLKVTVSFGITHLAGIMPAALDRAYTRADKVMYEAKEAGRNQTKMSE